ncbi:MAG TPA: hypothetical protein VGD81_14490 [Opitutaceae bacterium]
MTPEMETVANPATVIANFLCYAALAGLLGALAMTVVMRLMSRRDPRRGDMVVAVGSLLTKTRDNARLVGVILHGISAIAFGMLYTVIMIALNMTEWPGAFFMGVGFGTFHGIVVSLSLVWVVADQHPLEEYRNAGPAVFLEHFAGHVVYGAVVGLVIAFAPV